MSSALRLRASRLRLGAEEIELTEFLAPRPPVPPDARANDRSFQHIAIVVSDMASLRAAARADVEHASTGPQRLPDWNRMRGGISAFYFRDPDGHVLEMLASRPTRAPRSGTPRPPLSRHRPHGHRRRRHEASLRFYRDTLGLHVAGESENYDIEQEHLNNVFGARLRITALRARPGRASSCSSIWRRGTAGRGRPSPRERHRALADDAGGAGRRGVGRGDAGGARAAALAGRGGVAHDGSRLRVGVSGSGSGRPRSRAGALNDGSVPSSCRRGGPWAARFSHRVPEAGGGKPRPYDTKNARNR